eukprot:14015808-Alexandrium_andersonii.AAC.1
MVSAFSMIPRSTAFSMIHRSKRADCALDRGNFAIDSRTARNSSLSSRGALPTARTLASST